MLYQLWFVAWCFTIFCLLPSCNHKIAEKYSKIFGTNVYTSLWYEMSMGGLIVTVALMFITLIV